ncbi:cytoplasmic fragile-X interacting family-domain-containing protein [Gorgonomyces haynaldii]|nr:cytoplasmic fragile-X interacting family-domain-containing protein [Gorgonomyces haynaldii]
MIPEIAPPHLPIVKESLGDINFADLPLFDLEQYQLEKDKTPAQKYFVKEAAYISKLNLILLEGRELVYSMYAFRSCGKAIPQVQSQDQTNKEQLYRISFQILRPEIGRMFQLMHFRDKFIQTLTETMTGVIADVRDREIFPSETFLLTLAHCFDLTVSIDAMKNFKGAMNNDLSMYKRAISFFPKEQSEQEQMQLPTLAFFIATQDQFAMDVKKAFATLNNVAEDVVMDMMNTLMDSIEQHNHLNPDERHQYLRALAFATSLIDGDTEERDITKRKHLKLDRLGKLFKSFPIVPLYGDISILLSTILGKMPHLQQTKWDLYDEEVIALSKNYLLGFQMDQARQEFKANVSNLLELSQIAKKSDLLAQDQQRVYEIVLRALKCLSLFSMNIKEQTAFKFTHPFTSQDPKYAETSNYEMAVKYNYSQEELLILIEMISMIKNLGGHLLSLESRIQKIVDKHIYDQTQQFTSHKLNEHYQSSVKKKKPIAPMLKHVIDALQDMDDLKNRKDPISLTQLHFATAVLALSFDERTKGMKGGWGLLKEKYFSQAQVQDFNSFLIEAKQYPQMMDLSGTIRQCTDLSNLWFREFFLELSRKVQFPISTSLPWILTEFILESHTSMPFRDLFMPLDLYNDAAYNSLHLLKSQVIYDEIEAEVNLCFDQLLFKLGKRIFVHYKKAASIMLLPTDFKLEAFDGAKPFLNREALEIDAFEPILKQRNVSILGRNVDITKMLSQIIVYHIKASLSASITRFEASDLSFIMELDKLIETARLAHELLSKYLDLDDFDAILSEANEDVKMVECSGRIIAHTVQEIMQDIIPNFCFNNMTGRMIRSSVFYAPPIERPPLPKVKLMYLFGSRGLSFAYTSYFGLFKDFMGECHFRSIYRLVGPKGIFLIGQEVTKHMQLIVERALLQSMDTIQSFLAKERDPVFERSFVGEYDFLEEKYQSIIHFKDLKPEILQGIREIGNCLVVMQLLEEHMRLSWTKSKALIQDVIGLEEGQKTYLATLGQLDPQLKEENSLVQYTPMIQEVIRIAKTMESRPRIVKQMMQDLRQSCQVLSEWEKQNQKEKQFFRIWNAIQFVLCVPSVSGDRNIRELFGDAIFLAGAALTHVLKQTQQLKMVNHLTKLILLNSKEQSTVQKGQDFLQTAVTVTRLIDEWAQSIEKY